MLDRLITLVFVLLLSQTIFSQSDKILLKTNTEGEVIQGSIEDLIEKINDGHAVRVAWQHDMTKDGKPDLIHWVDAEFISILGGHVFNQITPIYRQVPKLAIPQIEIIDSPMQWTGIIGTNGVLISRMIIPDIDEIEDEQLRSRIQQSSAIKEKKVATIWALAN